MGRPYRRVRPGQSSVRSDVQVPAAYAGERTDRLDRLLDRARLGCLADRVGQREQVVGGRSVLVVRGQSQHLPAPRRREPLTVHVAQVVGVRLGVGRERTDHRGHVGVDVGEGGRGRTTTGGARTTTEETHARTLQRATAAPP